MPMRTTQWKWMALGGVICLLAIVGVSKWCANQAAASGETAPPMALPLSPPALPANVPPTVTPSSDIGGRVGPISLPTLRPGSLLEARPIAPPPFLREAPATSSATAPIAPLPAVAQEPPPLPEPLPAIRTTPATPVLSTRPSPRPSGLMPTAFTEQTPPAPTVTPPTPSLPDLPPPVAPLSPVTTPVAPVTPAPVQQVPYQESPRTFRPTPHSALPSEPGEPPLTPAGPTQMYRVRHAGETVREIARKTLGTVERSPEILRLNPSLRGDKIFGLGETVYLPADACIPTEDVEAVRPLPAMRREAIARLKVVLPMTGTFPCNLDEQRTVTLPRAIRDQLGDSPTILVSPGPDQCLWLTNQAHLNRLAERLEKSSAREVDVRVFKRLYFAQTEKLPISPEGRVTISEKLAQFAGLHQEVVLVGIDDHLELWDVSRWRQYTQEKSTSARTVGEPE